MAFTYSHQFFANIVGAGASIFFQVPAGYTTVLRDLELYNGSASSGDLSISLVDVSGSLLAVVVAAHSIAVGATFQWTGRAVMSAGQGLQCYTATGLWRIWASGYLLTAA